MQAIADRIRQEIVEHAEPWRYGTLDDFFPADVFAELVESLPGLNWDRESQQVRRAKTLPPATMEILTSGLVLDAIRERYGFTGGQPKIEVVYRTTPLAAHFDRKDKKWNGQVYLAGDAQGTELYDRGNQLAGVIEWKPNRLSCWTIPPGREKHAAPASKGRYILLWWLLGR